MDPKKTLAIVKKLSAKGKMNAISLSDLLEVLNTFDPGWSTDAVVSLRPSGDHDLLKFRDDFPRAFPDKEVRLGSFGQQVSLWWPGNTAPDDKEMKTAEQVMDRLLAEQAVIDPKVKNPPLNYRAEVGKTYLPAKPKLKKNTYGLEFVFTGARFGEKATRVISPSGNVYDIFASRDAGLPLGIWTFLYKSEGVHDKAKEHLNDVGDDLEKKVVHDRFAKDAGTIGTCPACTNHQKLSKTRLSDGHPSMVLHGYNRPGWGYVLGNCFGVGFPPWELSPLGGEAWVDKLEMMIEGAIDATKKEESAKFYNVAVKLAPRTLERATISSAGEATYTGESISDKEFESTYHRQWTTKNVIDQPSQAKRLFNEMQKLRLDRIDRNRKGLETMQDEMKKRLSAWEARPLPGTVGASTLSLLDVVLNDLG